MVNDWHDKHETRKTHDISFKQEDHRELVQGVLRHVGPRHGEPQVVRAGRLAIAIVSGVIIIRIISFIIIDTNVMVIVYYDYYYYY